MAYVMNEPGAAPRKGEGAKSRALPPALNPESCALVQPYKDFFSKGYIQSLQVEFTPMGTNVFCTLEKSLLKDGEAPMEKIAVGDAKNRILPRASGPLKDRRTRPPRKNRAYRSKPSARRILSKALPILSC